MNQGDDKYGRALTRLLHEVRFAISKRNAYNEICRVAPRTSWGFFSYCSLALFNDMIAHASKVLDMHPDCTSFWYLVKCDERTVNLALKSHSLELSDIRDLSEKLKIVRDKTHFHIDKQKVFSPSGVWNEANITGDEFNHILERMWVALNLIHKNYFGFPFGQPIYDGSDIEDIIDLARAGGIVI